MRKQNYHKNFKNSYNRDNRKNFKKKEDRPIVTGTSVEVRNDDVNGALRRLKKILERDNRQKDLAKQEYYEKPSRKRKRKADAAKARWAREVDQQRRAGNWVDSGGNDQSWQKTKRKRRRHVELQKKIAKRGKG
jgi:small subunit ribosomal protein S21